MTKQDFLHGLSIVGLTYLTIQESLKPLISAHDFAIVTVIMLAFNTTVYYADILGKGGEVNPPQPTQTPTT